MRSAPLGVGNCVPLQHPHPHTLRYPLDADSFRCTHRTHRAKGARYFQPGEGRSFPLSAQPRRLTGGMDGLTRGLESASKLHLRRVLPLVFAPVSTKHN